MERTITLHGNPLALSGTPVAVGGKLPSFTLVDNGLKPVALADYAGKPISAFISDFILSDSSMSYSARYFAHLCADGGWRRFEANDWNGHRFAIELNLSLVESRESGVFLLSVRRAEENG